LDSRIDAGGEQQATYLKSIRSVAVKPEYNLDTLSENIGAPVTRRSCYSLDTRSQDVDVPVGLDSPDGLDQVIDRAMEAKDESLMIDSGCADGEYSRGSNDSLPELLATTQQLPQQRQLQASNFFNRAGSARQSLSGTGLPNDTLKNTSSAVRSVDIAQNLPVESHVDTHDGLELTVAAGDHLISTALRHDDTVKNVDGFVADQSIVLDGGPIPRDVYTLTHNEAPSSRQVRCEMKRTRHAFDDSDALIWTRLRKNSK